MKQIFLLFAFLSISCVPVGERSELHIETLKPNSVTTLPVEEVGELKVDFLALKSKILQPMCIKCHRAFNEEKGILKLVKAGKPDSSLLFQVVEDGSMPMGARVLTTAELELVRSYIMDLRLP